jgi:multidrug efflux pump subunit AcrA (membrane-fusion protein)
MLNLSKHKVESKILEQRLYSLELLHTPPSSRVLAYWLYGIFGFMLIVMFLPWQQNIRGNGAITAFKPENRPQQVNSPIGGRIIKWYVQEGQFVHAGDTIVTLAEVKDKYLDPLTAKRTSEQVKAKADIIKSMRNKVAALEMQISALQQGMELSIQKAQNKVLQTQFKLSTDSAENEAARINYDIALQQFERQKLLFEKGLKSRTELEQRQLKLQETAAKFNATQNKLQSTQNELINAKIELSSLRAEYQDKIAKAESEKQSALSYGYDTEGSLAKLENELQNIEIRNSFYTLRAPQSGYVVRALQEGIGEIIKENDPVVTIMPESQDLAAEIYVTATDVPLITPGRHVRLQFDGWPALQFSGWPSVSVGTFGGRVSVVDYVNSKGGYYRILVVPDTTHDQNWPKQLRIGSGVYGWAMLDVVPIWFEIWRQLNGFPPSISTPPGEEVLNPFDKKDKIKSGPKIKK